MQRFVASPGASGSHTRCGRCDASPTSSASPTAEASTALDRKPGIIDWVEDLVFTGLLFVAATMLLYEVLGWELRR